MDTVWELRSGYVSGTRFWRDVIGGNIENKNTYSKLSYCYSFYHVPINNTAPTPDL